MQTTVQNIHNEMKTSWHGNYNAPPDFEIKVKTKKKKYRNDESQTTFLSAIVELEKSVKNNVKYKI